MTNDMWVPIAKLSYSCYIVHYPVLAWMYRSDRSAFYLDDFTVSMEFVTGIVFTFSMALVLYLLVECPCMNLERILYGRR